MSKHTMGQLRADRDISEMFHVDCSRIHSDAFCLRIPASTRHDADKQWVNAQFIVRACNAHDDLLEACRIALLEIDGLVGQQAMPDNSWSASVATIRTAIAKAQGEEAGS